MIPKSRLAYRGKKIKVPWPTKTKAKTCRRKPFKWALPKRMAVKFRNNSNNKNNDT
jgi:hypothetical protein